MLIMFLSVLFIYGTIFGSFFNVVGVRLPAQKLFQESRSYCDRCGHQLRWVELIPIISYIKQKGCCKNCDQKISILYPLIEGITGFLFAYSYYIFSWTPLFMLSLLLISMILPITVSDLIYQKIPNRILLLFTPIFMLYRFYYPIHSFGHSLLSSGFAFLLVGFIIMITRGGMGIGDLKYYTLLGFVFGLKDFLLLFFLSTIYGVIAGVIIMKVNKTGIKTRIAFAPYIGLATLTVLYFGTTISFWYEQFLLL